MKKDYVGLTWHCHHEVLIEFCYSFNERVGYIKNNKPINERKTRIKLFKPAQKIPRIFKKAYAERQKAYADWQKADADWQKADADWWKADADWQKAYADWQKAYADWQKAYADFNRLLLAHPKELDRWHKAECGCKEWNGKTIVFPEAK